MSRKTASFGQLMGYIDHHGYSGAYHIRHNLFGRSVEHIQREFKDNASLLKKRKNGVFLYHEIVSIKRHPHLPEKEQKDRLYDIAQKYLAMRGVDNLCYGGLHADQDHSLHYHLMLSSNEAGRSKNLRLSKREFENIKIDLERYVLEKHPELEQEPILTKESVKERKEKARSQKEAELRRRTKKLTQKDILAGKIWDALASSRTIDEFYKHIGDMDYKIYILKKHIGVEHIYKGNKCRLGTLDTQLLRDVRAFFEGRFETKAQLREREKGAQCKAEEHHNQQEDTQEQEASRYAADKEQKTEKNKNRADTSHPEQKRERAKKDPSQKEKMRMRLDTIFNSSHDRETLLVALQKEGLELYVRGKYTGVIDLETGNKHRFHSLDVDYPDRFDAIMHQEKGWKTREENKSEPEKNSQRSSSFDQQNNSASEKEKNEEFFDDDKTSKNQDTRYDGLSDMQKQWQAEFEEKQRRKKERQKLERDQGWEHE